MMAETNDVCKCAEHMLKVMYATDGVGLAGPGWLHEAHGSRRC